MRHIDDSRPHWRLWIDTGGTFTDCIAVDPDGYRRRLKILSSGRLRGRVIDASPKRVAISADWTDLAAGAVGFSIRFAEHSATNVARVVAAEGVSLILDSVCEAPVGATVELFSGEPAPIVAARLLTRSPFPRALPPVRLRLATTRGTNALLERAVAPTAFFVTQGFADLLDIGDQRRPDLFALDIHKPAPLHHRVIEAPERLDATGAVIQPLDFDRIQDSAKRALDRGCRCAAIALMHSWRNPGHELALADELRRIGYEHLSLSSQLSPEPKLLPRARTAVVNAALTPVMSAFLSAIENAAPAAPMQVMTSAGGLTPTSSFRPVDGLLSGPAGGVIGAAEVGASFGCTRLITFDMGGTSTDVARVDGAPDLVFEHRVGDATLMSPALRVETVAAGGGSMCGFENGRPFVGPRSAGADPGPACYGAGGPLTITDVNLLLGRIDPQRFGVPVSIDAAQRACAQALSGAPVAARTEDDRCAWLQGFLELANEHMAAAIRRISVRQGYDPAQYTLIAFGGAGPQHACAVARRLGCTDVLIPSDASLLSACGVGAAPLTRVAQRSVLTPLPDDAALELRFRPLVEDAVGALQADGAANHDIEVQRLVDLRLVGQAFSLQIDLDQAASVREAFLTRHEAAFGFAPTDASIELAALRVVARWWEPLERAPSCDAPPKANKSPTRGRVWFDGWRDVPIYTDTTLALGEPVKGPALIVQRHTVIVVEPEWKAELINPIAAEGASGAAVRLRIGGRQTSSVSTRVAAPIMRDELIASRLEAIADQMGAALQRAALSTNVKERLDYSCAILNPAGEVVVSAPHIPVHLGALGPCVRAVMQATSLAPGDMVVTNHPAFGGSHLPDVTLVAPVHTSDGALIGYTASRAHHAEIGGIRPGSMPPDAKSLAEEGVVIPPTHLVRTGKLDWAPITRLLTESSHPTRSLRENQSDLLAAVAAARQAERSLRALQEEFGGADVQRAMERTLARTEEAVRSAILARAPFNIAIDDALDDASPLRIALSFSDSGAVIDFTGSAPVHPGNLNAPAAVTHSALAYVMRLLIDTPVTINDGLLRAVTIVAPSGLLNPEFPADPAHCPAVAGGNVETSQRLVNALVRALRLAADSQGTMNNVIIGDDTFSYYETLAGGAGATAHYRGADAVHTHMTNTAITDPEIFELRYPVRVVRTQIRQNSGGRGACRGGNGLVREFEFLRSLEVSVLTQNRVRGPRGVEGGGDGAPGEQRLVRADGRIEWLRSVDGASVGPGDRLIIATPGGGGWGEPRLKRSESVMLALGFHSCEFNRRLLHAMELDVNERPQ